MARFKRTVPAQPDDRSFILNPDVWPRWPYLPLKRRNHSLEDKNLGLLVADGFKNGFTVWHGYLYCLPKTREEFLALPKTHYNTVDELLADGWVVD